MTNEVDLTRRLTGLERRMDRLFDHLQLDDPHLARQEGDPAPAVHVPLEGYELVAIPSVLEQAWMGPSGAKCTVEQTMEGHERRGRSPWTKRDTGPEGAGGNGGGMRAPTEQPGEGS